MDRADHNMSFNENTAQERDQEKAAKKIEYTEIYAWGGKCQKILGVLRIGHVSMLTFIGLDDEMGQLGVGGTNNTKTEDPNLRKVCTIPKICSFNIKILKIA